jgi:hypothetical protein
MMLAHIHINACLAAIVSIMILQTEVGRNYAQFVVTQVADIKVENIFWF